MPARKIRQRQKRDKSRNPEGGQIKSESLPPRENPGKLEEPSPKGDSLKKEKYIITAALPYANGPIHIGHLLEYVQADIYARFLKSQGKDAIYICASDMHGTPIEVNAAKAGKSPETFAHEFREEHQHDFASFLIQFDNYYQTHSPENKELAEYFFRELRKKGYIITKRMKVIYCSHCARHLPDRYVKGTCPNCTSADQYGDVCEHCSSALKGIDLLNPKCSLCGRTPIQKESEHYFFTLGKFAAELKKWISAADCRLQPEVCNWLQEWLSKGLDDWCISRDAPYFGFEIPGSLEETGERKYFYVWHDAPIGYISSTKNYCDTQNDKLKLKLKLQWDDYWKGKNSRVHHFIGKDIAYFHFLFWPAELLGMGMPLPELTVHGFITVDGQKMSKSRGTFFTAKDFLKLYPAESLRFFYANHLDRRVIDVDLNFDDFIALNNNVLGGNLGNFCYRVLTFAEKNYGEIKSIAPEKELVSKIQRLVQEIEQNYGGLDFRSAVRNMLRIADIGNAYFQASEVWKKKDDEKSKKAVGWCVNIARILSILAAPILPAFSAKVQHALGENDLRWKDLNFAWRGKVKKAELLVQKLEHLPAAQKFPLRMIVGKILKVENHPDADSLYLLQVDLGKEIGKKQVVAGLKKHLAKEVLLNRQAVFCANLKPAKIRGQLSAAMILVGDDGSNVALLEVQKTKVGEEVHFAGLENGVREISFDEFKKLELHVRSARIYFDGKKLVSKSEDVICHGVKDGTRIY